MLNNITIIGNGAIGTLWAHHLTLAGCNVTLVGRKVRPTSRLLTLKTYDNTLIHQPINYLVNQLPAKNDLVLVVTKAYQIVNALSPYLAALTQCPIVLMHNGLGAVQQLPLNQQHSVYLATTSHGVLMDNDICHHTGLGQTMIGCFGQSSESQAQVIAQLLHRALPPVQTINHIERALWQKLAINCAINPLTALNNCRNGELSQPQFQQQLDLIIGEISQLTAALNLNLAFQELRDSVDDVIAKTAQNFSSMHQDIAFKRATEIDYINGYIVQQGIALGIATPHNQQLWHAINALTLDL